MNPHRPADDDPMQALRRRHPSDVVRLLLGACLFVASTLPVRPDAVGRVEAGLFDAVNGLPDWLFVVFFVPMQAGWVGAVGIASVTALALRRWRLARDLALAGVGAWLVAGLVKSLYQRPRPGALLEAVVHRGGEASGLGFISGHTAVAAALATTIVLHLPRRWRLRLYLGVVVVGLARLYVGAHLPLDIAGGAAVGWMVAAVVRLALGAPTGRPSTKRLTEGLGHLGIDVAAIESLHTHAPTSAVFSVATDDGVLVAKVLTDRPQDRDVLHRWWLRVRALAGLPRARADHRSFASPRLQVEHEAATMLAAGAAGVRVPEVVYAGPLDAELAVLLTRWVDGSPVTDPAALPPSLRADAEGQLALLHGAGLAHGDLRAENLLVLDHELCLLDFGESRFLAAAEDMAQDRADLAAMFEGR